MIPEEISQAIMEFSQRCREVSRLRMAILFGSAILGTLNKKSDIDVLLILDLKKGAETSPEAEAIHKIAGDVASKWDLPYPFAFVIYGKNEAIEESFLRDVMRDGHIIYARMDALIDGSKGPLRPYILFSYSLKGLSPKNKMALQRGLYGYKTERRFGKKKYLNSSPGIVGNNGRRIGTTAFVLNYAEAESVRSLFKKCNCSFKEIPIWREAEGDHNDPEGAQSYSMEMASIENRRIDKPRMKR